MILNIQIIILMLLFGCIFFKVSSAFLFHYQSTAAIGYRFPGTNPVFKLGWSLEIYIKKDFSIGQIKSFIELSEVFTINNVEIQALHIDWGTPRSEISDNSFESDSSQHF